MRRSVASSNSLSARPKADETHHWPNIRGVAYLQSNEAPGTRGDADREKVKIRPHRIFISADTFV